MAFTAEEMKVILTVVDDEFKSKMGEATKRVHGSDGSFSHALKEMKMESVQAQRQARFFTREIAEIIPIGKEGSAVLSKLMQIGLEGFGVGAALVAAGLGAAALWEHIKEVAEEAKKLRDISFSVGESFDEMARKVRQGLGPSLTKVQQEQRAWREGQQKELNKAAHDLDEYRVKQDTALEKVKQAWRNMVEDFKTGGEGPNKGKDVESREGEQHVEALKIRKEEMEDEKRQKEMKKALADESKMLDLENTQEVSKIRASFRSKEEQAQAEFNGKMLKLNKETNWFDPDAFARGIALQKIYQEQLSDQLAKIKEASQIKSMEAALKLGEKEMSGVQKLQAKFSIDLEKIMDDRSMSAEEQQRRIKELGDQYDDDLRRNTANNLSGEKKYESEKFDILKHYGEMRDQEHLAQNLRFQKEDELSLKHFKDGIIGLAPVMGRVFAEMALGHKTVMQSFKEIASAVVQMATKVIEAYAATAAAKAFDSEAGVPFVGIFLGATAAAAASAAVLGLISQLPGAATGARIPAGVNPAMQLHENERVLNAAETAGYESGIGSGGGAGGIHFHLHGAFIDGQSVRSFVSTPEFINGVREAQRNGVWPG